MLQQHQWPIYIKDALQACQLQTGLLLIEASSTLTPLTAGWSNQNFLLCVDNQQYVLRINSLESSAICNRDSEIECWKIAAKEKLAPALFWVSGDKKFYLSEYLQQPDDTTVNKDNLLQLLNKLTKLPLPTHNISTSEQWHIYRQKISLLDKKIIEENIHQQPTLLTMKKTWQHLQKKLFEQQSNMIDWLAHMESCQIRPQFCHRDLNINNILVKNDHLVCIDFEYACASHPLFELAAIVCSHNLSKTEEEKFTSQYLLNHPNLTKDAYKALPTACRVFWCFFQCWTVIMMGSTLVIDAKAPLSDNEVFDIEASFNRFKQFSIEYEHKFY